MRSKNKQRVTPPYFHYANNGPTIVTEIVNTAHDVRGVKERLRVCGHPHEETHKRHRQPGNQSIHGSPYHEIPEETLDRPCRMDHPWADKNSETAVVAVEGDGGIEKAREDAGVGSDVLEDRDGVER